MDIFGDTLRKLRLQDGMTQAELAKKLGVAESMVSMYETGARRPRFEILEAIADTFNVNLSYLTTGKYSFDITNLADLTADEIKEMLSNSDFTMICEKLSALTPEARKLAREYIELLLQLQEKQKQ